MKRITRSNTIIIICLMAIIDQGYADNNINNCKNKLDQCQTKFFDELKQFKFNDHEASYYQLCSPDGSYMRFVDCIRNLNENECKQPLHRELCNKRGLKMSSYRYTWKSNIAHDICYRTTSLMDQDFFKYEKCMSEVLNTPSWECDMNYYEKTKSASGPEACGYWKQFRDCVYKKVEDHCGKMVANLSDYLFHAHASYFSKYSNCLLPGEPHTKCWLDLIDSIPRIPKTTTSVPSTTVKAAKPTTSKVIPEPTTKKILKATPVFSTTEVDIMEIEETKNDILEHDDLIMEDNNSKTMNVDVEHDNLNENELHNNLVREAKLNIATANSNDHNQQQLINGSINLANYEILTILSFILIITIFV